MKTISNPLFLVVAVSMSALTAAGFLLLKKGIKAKPSLALEKYVSEMVPLYQQRGDLVEQIARQANLKDPNIDGILSHRKNWRPRTKIEAAEIEEINVFLDTHLSNHRPELEEAAFRKPQLKVLIAHLERLDERLREARSQSFLVN